MNHNATRSPASTAGQKLPLAGFVLDLGAEQLRDASGHAVELRPQALAVLRLLALNAGRLVTKDELLAAVWPGLVVTDGSLVQAVVDVRRALGDAGQLVKTVPRRGYMLVADAVRAAVAAEPAVQPPSPSIAVLPFDDPEGGNPLLARGVAQELVLELGRNADLRVVSHHSSFALAGNADLPPAELGQRLRARYLVDGTVTRIGERLRVGVELIDCRDDRIVWSARHEVAGAGVPALRDELVQRIAASVHSKLRASELRRALEKPPKSLDSYEMTTRAFALLLRFDAAATREARALLERVIALDPDNARAWAYLGNLDSLDIIFRVTGERRRRHWPECLAQLRRALALDAELPITWRVLGYTYSAAGDFANALAAAQRAVELAPSDAENLSFLSKAQLEVGRVEQSLATVRHALDLFPLPPPWVRHMQSQALWANGELDDALRAADACLAELPQYWPSRTTRLVILFELGRLDDACRDGEVLKQQWPRLTWAIEGQFAPAGAARLRERSLSAAVAAGLQPG